MSVTESVRVGDDRGSTPSPVSRARRWTDRLSVGHGLMVGAGLLAALLNFAVLRGNDETVWVVTAARDIQPGETLRGELLSTVQLDADSSALSGLFVGEGLAELDGATAAARIGAGEPVLRSAVVPPGSADGLRAMSVPVDPAHAVGGRLRAGDRVDVMRCSTVGRGTSPPTSR